jgi:hypothetical protein
LGPLKKKNIKNERYDWDQGVNDNPMVYVPNKCVEGNNIVVMKCPNA